MGRLIAVNSFKPSIGALAGSDSCSVIAFTLNYAAEIFRGGILRQPDSTRRFYYPVQTIH